MARRALAATLSAAVVLAASAVTALPAQAVPVGCAADPYESQEPTVGYPFPQSAPIPVGGSVRRVLCQDADTGVDREYFTFSAVGGKAYSVGLVGSGNSAVAVDGLQVAGVFRQGPDGSWSSLEAPQAQSGQRFTTPVLSAGTYGLVAVNTSEQMTSDFVMVPKTIQGNDGVFSLGLRESTPAPSVVSISVPSTIKANSRTSASFTLSGPVPEGGMSLYGEGRGGYISIGRTWLTPGATRGTFVISTGAATKGTVFTVSVTTRVGATLTATTTVK